MNKYYIILRNGDRVSIYAEHYETNKNDTKLLFYDKDGNMCDVVVLDNIALFHINPGGEETMFPVK